jgi:transcriptional regulator with XRE-family HTH domain
MTVENGLPPGERIRLYRRRIGLTQEQCAQLKGCTVSAWRKWESGERQVVAFSDWIEIARILRVRDLYKLTGLPVSEMPEEPVEHDTVPAIRAAMVSFDPRLTDDEPDVDRLDNAVETAWDIWQERRPFTQVGTLLPGLITEVRATIPVVDGPERDRLLRTSSKLYFLARAFTKRVGAHDVSLLAADRALAAAIKADDLDYRAAAAWNLGMILAEQGHTEVVAELAQDAAAELEPTLSDQAPWRMSIYGALHLLRATQYARLGNEHRAMSALDQAELVAVKLGDRNDFRTVFGPTNVGVYRIWLAVELSKPGEAIQAAQRYDVTTMPSVERRFSYFAGLARAYTIRSEDVAAVHMLLRAKSESEAELRHNVDLRATVRELLRRESSITRPELRPVADSMGILT